jgi:hypothetical protein
VVHLLIVAVVIGIGIGIGRQLVTGRRPGHHPPPGWYSDPWQLHTWRWWNGAWTDFTQD